MTDEQLAKARQLRDDAGLDTVSFEQGYVEDLPFEDGTFDVVVSNGVINLSPDKAQVFAEANRVLKPGGRLALSDIINAYTDVIEAADFDIVEVRENPQYEFISEQAQGACQKYGVKSISLGARKR